MRSFVLDGDGCGEDLSACGNVRHFDGNGAGQIPGEHGFLLPVEVPATVDRQNAIAAGGEVFEFEAAVEVALVGDEGAYVAEFFGGEEQDEGSRDGFAIALDDAFDGVGADVEDHGEVDVTGGGNVNVVGGKRLIAGEYLANEASPAPAAEREVVIARGNIQLGLAFDAVDAGDKVVGMRVHQSYQDAVGHSGAVGGL